MALPTRHMRLLFCEDSHDGARAVAPAGTRRQAQIAAVNASLAAFIALVDSAMHAHHAAPPPCANTTASDRAGDIGTGFLFARLDHASRF